MNKKELEEQFIVPFWLVQNAVEHELVNQELSTKEGEPALGVPDIPVLVNTRPVSEWGELRFKQPADHARWPSLTPANQKRKRKSSTLAEYMARAR